MKIYVASSWRCPDQQAVVGELRAHGFEVYDFRNPAPGNKGFHWSEIDPAWQSWNAEQYIASLRHPIAESGFALDWQAMLWADACVLVLPCGRSAHLEAGYFVGANKILMILTEDKNEPELMYKMATGVYTDLSDIIQDLKYKDGAILNLATSETAGAGTSPAPQIAGDK